MQVQNAKRLVRLQTWANEINSCRQSGISVKKWCAANNVNIKTYYNHLRLVREEMLEMTTPAQRVPRSLPIIMPETSATSQSVFTALAQFPAISPKVQQQTIQPSLAPLQCQEPAGITVYIGSHRIEINNNADGALIGQVLTAVSRI